MLYPVCPTCQFILADKQIPYEKGYEKIINNDKLSNEKKQNEIEELLNNLGLIRYCCRMRMISFIDQSKLII
tara:strand:- start:10743 stop:10958 length:216 start_codon:yes stop_codon:yes gene_type:complete